MFTSSLVVENPDTEAGKTLLLKQEGDPDCVQAVWVNQTPVEFSVEDGYLRVPLTTLPGETASIRVVYRNSNMEEISDRDSSGTKFKVAAKRYLSEFRDNYLSRSDFSLPEREQAQAPHEVIPWWEPGNPAHGPLLRE